MFEDILEVEREDEDDEPVKVEEMSVNDTAVVLYRIDDANMVPGQVVHINMRLLKILEIHNHHIIVTILGPIPKWSIRQYVKEKSGHLYNNIEFDGTKILVFDRQGIVRGRTRLSTRIM